MSVELLGIVESDTYHLQAKVVRGELDRTDRPLRVDEHGALHPARRGRRARGRVLGVRVARLLPDLDRAVERRRREDVPELGVRPANLRYGSVMGLRFPQHAPSATPEQPRTFQSSSTTHVPFVSSSCQTLILRGVRGGLGKGDAHHAPLIETTRCQPQAVKVISDVGDEVAVRILNDSRLYHGTGEGG